MKNVCTNEVYVSGTVVTKPTYDHACREIEFYKFFVSVQRNSGVCDLIPVCMPKTILDNAGGVEEGDAVSIHGEFRSYNEREEKRLMLFLYGRSIEVCLESKMDNVAFIEGFICKKGDVRRTPKGKTILDILLAVNRGNGKSSYIPCIMWHMTDEKAEKLKIGDKLNVTGRVQSREYEKKYETGETVIKTAYELSVKEYRK